jgi:hypothetical protein
MKTAFTILFLLSLSACGHEGVSQNDTIPTTGINARPPEVPLPRLVCANGEIVITIREGFSDYSYCESVEAYDAN